MEQIKRGSVYEVSSAQVRIWNGKKKLSTTLRSTVTPVKDNSLAQLYFPRGKLRKSIISDKSKCRIFTQFTNCKEISLRQLLRIIQLSAARIVLCDRCGHSMRAENCFSQVCAKFALQAPEGDNIIMTAFEDTLTATAQDVSSVSETELAEVLLLMEHVLVKDDCKGSV